MTATSPAQDASTALDERKLVHFNPDERIAALEEANRALQIKNEALESENQALRTKNGDLQIANTALVQQNHVQGSFIVYLAKRFFSSDDNARWFAGKSGKPVDEKYAHWHWCRNGGRLKFEKDFPTHMHVMRFFVPTAKMRDRIRRFLHTT